MRLFLTLLPLGQRNDSDVDLINLRMVDTVFQHLIIQTGRVLSDIDPFERASFEILVMGKYQKLNQERSKIFAGIQKTGKVFFSSTKRGL